MWFDTLLGRACYREESAKSCGLHNNVGYVGAWVKFLHGSNIFLRGPLSGSKIFAWVFFFCVNQPFLLDEIIFLYYN